MANGVLSDTYYPTVDNTNVETLQYVVTDGATFTDLQTRGTSYSVRPLGTVPKAIDVITPPGVAQSEELDYTVNAPVTIAGVFI